VSCGLFAAPDWLQMPKLTLRLELQSGGSKQGRVCVVIGNTQPAGNFVLSRWQYQVEPHAKTLLSGKTGPPQLTLPEIDTNKAAAYPPRSAWTLSFAR
jgi:hypothetical protein